VDRPPLPPFTRETAVQKVRLAEDVWNSRDPKRVSLAYTPDSRWRNRSEFPQGREQIVALFPNDKEKALRQAATSQFDNIVRKCPGAEAQAKAIHDKSQAVSAEIQNALAKVGKGKPSPSKKN